MFINTRIYFINSLLFWLQNQRNEPENGLKGGTHQASNSAVSSHLPLPTFVHMQVLPELKVRFILEK